MASDDKLHELWAWIAQEPGGEAICSVTLGQETFGTVFGKRANADSIRPIMNELAGASGCTIRLIRFTRQEILEEVSPDARH